MKRDGSVDLVFAKDAPARRAGQDQPLPRPGDADVAEAALLFQLRFVFA